jgi:hypothetical protein
MARSGRYRRSDDATSAVVKVPDTAIEELREYGFTMVEGFLAPDELRDAQDALWTQFPHPDEYFTDPHAPAHAMFAHNQFAGLRAGFCSNFALNRLALHPDLIELAEQFLGSSDLQLYKIELWAKYSGATDYDQAHHRDFGNHSIVVPRRAEPPRQLTTFVLLSDVTDGDGPTKVIPLSEGTDVPYWPNALPMGALTDREVSIVGPAGTLFAYRTDILHRGSRITGERRARFALLADYQTWGTRWLGKLAWPNHALSPGWIELIERASPRQRALLGFPGVGDEYWDEQTLHDVQLRYPRIDLSPYRAEPLPRDGIRDGATPAVTEITP